MKNKKNLYVNSLTALKLLELDYNGILLSKSELVLPLFHSSKLNLQTLGKNFTFFNLFGKNRENVDFGLLRAAHEALHFMYRCTYTESKVCTYTESKVCTYTESKVCTKQSLYKTQLVQNRVKGLYKTELVKNRVKGLYKTQLVQNRVKGLYKIQAVRLGEAVPFSHHQHGRQLELKMLNS